MYNNEQIIDSLEVTEEAIKEKRKEFVFYDLEFLLKNDKISLYDAYMRGASLNGRILEYLKTSI
jgi:hypothetical protein